MNCYGLLTPHDDPLATIETVAHEWEMLVEGRAVVTGRVQGLFERAICRQKEQARIGRRSGQIQIALLSLGSVAIGLIVCMRIAVAKGWMVVRDRPEKICWAAAASGGILTIFARVEGDRYVDRSEKENREEVEPLLAEAFADLESKYLTLGERFSDPQYRSSAEQAMGSKLPEMNRAVAWAIVARIQEVSAGMVDRVQLAALVSRLLGERGELALVAAPYRGSTGSRWLNGRNALIALASLSALLALRGLIQYFRGSTYRMLMLTAATGGVCFGIGSRRGPQYVEVGRDGERRVIRGGSPKARREASWVIDAVTSITGVEGDASWLDGAFVVGTLAVSQKSKEAAKSFLNAHFFERQSRLTPAEQKIVVGGHIGNGVRAGWNDTVGKIPFVGGMVRVEYPQLLCDALFVAACAIEAMEISGRVVEESAVIAREREGDLLEGLWSPTREFMARALERGKQGTLFSAIIWLCYRQDEDFKQMARDMFPYNAVLLLRAGKPTIERCVRFAGRALADHAQEAGSLLGSVEKVKRAAERASRGH